jgi:hypothetical protein
MTPTGIERQKTTANANFGGLMIGIIAVAAAAGMVSSATVRVPAMVWTGRYQRTAFAPDRNLDAPAGQPNRPQFTAAKAHGSVSTRILRRLDFAGGR